MEPLLPLIQVFPVYSAANKIHIPIPKKNRALWKRYFGVALLVGFLAGFYSWVESQVLPHTRRGILKEIQESVVEPLTTYWEGMNSLVLKQQEELKRGIQQLSKRGVIEK